MKLSLHPDDSALLSIAQSELLMGADDELLQHLAECQRCRSYVQDARDLVHRAEQQQMPAASEALLARIQSSRLKGTRIILSDVGETEPKSHAPVRATYRRAGLIGLAAATLIAFALTSATSDKHLLTNSTIVAPQQNVGSSERGSNGELLQAFSPLPTLLEAEGAPLPDGAHDALVNLDGSQLKPGVWTYVGKSITNGTIATPVRVVTVSLDTVTVQSQLVWRVVESVVSLHMANGDTLWMDRTTLRPISRHWYVGLFEFTENFGADRVENVMHHHADQIHPVDYTNRTLSALNASGSVIANEAQLRLIVATQPLDAKWHGVFGASGTVSGPNSKQPARILLHVDGDKRIEWNGVNEDCWRVLFGGNDNRVWYVSRRTHEVVRVESLIRSEYLNQTDLLTSR